MSDEKPYLGISTIFPGPPEKRPRERPFLGQISPQTGKPMGKPRFKVPWQSSFFKPISALFEQSGQN
jgi:hypothetical protein